jgi:hypothetical protein
MPYTPGSPNQERVVLTDTEIAHRIDIHTWTQAGAPNTDAWWILHTHTDKFGEHEGEPARVKVNGVEQTEEDSLADCHANASTWYWDAATKRLYLHVSGDDDPGGGAYIIAAYLWRRFATRPYVFGGRPYLPLVANDSIPPVAYVTGGYHEGGTKQTFGTVKFLNGEGYFDNDLSDYVYEGKRFTSRIGLNGAGDAGFSVFWDGWTSDITWTEREVEIAIEDLMTCLL